MTLRIVALSKGQVVAPEVPEVAMTKAAYDLEKRIGPGKVAMGAIYKAMLSAAPPVQVMEVTREKLLEIARANCLQSGTEADAISVADAILKLLGATP